MEPKDVCVNRIVDRYLEIAVEDEDLGCFLKSHDERAPFRILDRNDFSLHEGVEGGVASLYFQDVVVDAFVKKGIMEPSKADGIRMFFNLYNKLKMAGKVLERWKENGAVGGLLSSELEFSADYWKHDVVGHLEGAGIFSDSNILGIDIERIRGSGSSKGVGYRLGKEFYEVFDNLCGMAKIGGGGGCAERKSYLKTDTGRMPEILRGQAREAVAMYNGIVEFLGQYRDIECEGDGCPDKDEFKVYRLTRVEDAAGGE
ncbi:MAG: hypothetical protein JXA24_06650 [Proteobacteria bacterium]|nr:hypothetical protein [Pseudomonadota bacterium]